MYKNDDEIPEGAYEKVSAEAARGNADIVGMLSFGGYTVTALRVKTEFEERYVEGLVTATTEQGGCFHNAQATSVSVRTEEEADESNWQDTILDMMNHEMQIAVGIVVIEDGDEEEPVKEAA